jgi:flagellar biosynthetic protein FliP
MQQLLPNQVLTGLSVFLTATVMWPVWQQAYKQGVRPYAEGTYASSAARQAAFERAVEDSLQPLRRFMSGQIEATGNEAAIDLFLEYQQPEQPDSADVPHYYEDVSLTVLLPAYVLSELKTAFLIGFQIYLPFLIIDLVSAALLSGMGLLSVQPSVVSLPCKLLLFVLADGWFLTVQLLLESIGPGP